MNTQTFQDHWKDLLPGAYSWIEDIQPDYGDSPIPGALHITVFSRTENGVPEIISDLPEEIKKKAAALTLQDAGSPQMVLLGDITLLMVRMSPLAVSPAQLGRQVGLDAAGFLKGYRNSHVVFPSCSDISALDVFDGFACGLYDQGLFRKKDGLSSSWMPKNITFLTGADGFEDRRAFLKAYYLTRFLQDTPANLLTPGVMGQIAKESAEAAGIACRLYHRDEMKSFGMGSLLGVSRGSHHEPCFIVLEIPGEDPSRTIVLAGKGLTFDTGGISLKPSLDLAKMKYDMSGGAAVIGTALYLGGLKKRPPVNVVCLVGAVENMPGGGAVKPGDILTAMNGKTIEVLNTDAEGRLVLADVLSYARRFYAPECIIDAATLTGGVVIALGKVGAGILGNSRKLAGYLKQVSMQCGEPVWELPMWPELEQETKGVFADVCNIPKPTVKASSIMGAWFISHFAEDTPWVHLDIAGTAWGCAAVGYPREQSSAFGLRLMGEACVRYKSVEK